MTSPTGAPLPPHRVDCVDFIQHTHWNAVKAFLPPYYPEEIPDPTQEEIVIESGYQPYQRWATARREWEALVRRRTAARKASLAKKRAEKKAKREAMFNYSRPEPAPTPKPEPSPVLRKFLWPAYQLPDYGSFPAFYPERFEVVSIPTEDRY